MPEVTTNGLDRVRLKVDACAKAMRCLSVELESLVRSAVDRDVDLSSLLLALGCVHTTLELTAQTCAELRSTIEQFPLRAQSTW